MVGNQSARAGRVAWELRLLVGDEPGEGTAGTALEHVLDTLAEAGFDPEPDGTGHKALCPAHDDHNPSLAIGVGDDGRVLLTCCRRV